MNTDELEIAFKSRLSLRADSLDELSIYLTKRWNMFCFAERTDAFIRFAQKNAKALKAFEAILNENAAKKDSPASYSPKSQIGLYDKLSKPPFGPWTMGARWPQVLSSLAAVDKLVSVRQPLRILEIGCGTGFAYDWLRSKYSVNYTGIDFSSSTIEAANKLTKPGSDAVFQVADALTYESQEKFDMIFSIAGFPRSLDAKLVDRFASYLGNQGIFYIQVSGPPGPASLWVGKPQAVQLVFEDSTGGLEFAGGGYCHTSNYVFTTKDIRVVPQIYHAGESWSDFATCMNSGSIHERERNFGYFNSNGRPKAAWPFEPNKWESV
jgi:SAM-dependent methyltransferase